MGVVDALRNLSLTSNFLVSIKTLTVNENVLIYMSEKALCACVGRMVTRFFTFSFVGNNSIAEIHRVFFFQ